MIMSSERMMKPLSPERIIAKPKKHLVRKCLFKLLDLNWDDDAEGEEAKSQATQEWNFDNHKLSGY